MSTSEPAAKRVRMENGASSTLIIGTHNGHFHADEALAVYLLRLLPDYTSATLVRTRDPEVLKTCNVVVDVGGVHDDGVLRYDHHQREFAATFPGKHTKLSSAGLVWMHFGKRIISAVTGLAQEDANVTLLHEKLYEDFVEAFDANDNGISVYDPAAIRKAGISERFADRGFSIASVVNRYNYAPLDSSIQLSSDNPQAEEDARFLRASNFVGDQFSLELASAYSRWLPARAVVKDAFESRHQHDPSGRLIIVPHGDDGVVPWADHLYSLEAEQNVQGQVLYALFAETTEPGSKWRIRAVSLQPGSFENRKGLPEPWRGVRDQELSDLSGVPGCIFVHASGFIGGNATFHGALQMAKKALDM